jgi:hypothetical protein
MEMAEMMELLLARLDENTKTGQEILARMEAMHEDMKAEIEQRKAEKEADQEQRKRMTEERMVKFGGHLEGTKSDPEQTEPNPGMMQSVGEHQEVPREEAAVMPVGEPKKRRRNRNLAAERHSGTAQERHVRTRTDQGKTWTPGTIGRCPQKGDPPCKNGRTRHLETTDVQEEVSVETTRQKWSEGPMRRTAAISEEAGPQEASIGEHGKP